jgi:hypothetical protein
MAQREKFHKKPIGRGTKSDVIYNTDGRGAPATKKPGLRWRWEPFAAGTDR